MTPARKGVVVVVKHSSSYTVMAGGTITNDTYRIGIAAACNLQGRVLKFDDARFGTRTVVGPHDACYIVSSVAPECAKLAAGEDNAFDSLDDVKAALLPYKRQAVQS
jgi:hypothetical protein